MQLLSVQGHPILQHEYSRVKAGKPMEPLDTSRFRLAPPPANKQSDFNAWRKATDNAHSQLEHQYNRHVLCCIHAMICLCHAHDAMHIMSAVVNSLQVYHACCISAGF